MHTVEDTTVPWHYSATEGLNFASLEEGIVRVCKSRARLREGGGTNQIDLRWLTPLFYIILIGHYDDVSIPAVLWEVPSGCVRERIADGRERSPRRKAASFLTFGIDVGIGSHFPLPWW